MTIFPEKFQSSQPCWDRVMFASQRGCKTVHCFQAPNFCNLGPYLIWHFVWRQNIEVMDGKSLPWQNLDACAHLGEVRSLLCVDMPESRRAEEVLLGRE